MNNYYSLIKKAIKKNSKNSTIFNKSFYNHFCKQRYQDFKELSKSRFQIDKLKSKDNTYKTISQIYNSNVNRINKKKILSFYKKFEINLSLKISYDKVFKKKSDTETSLSTYVILGLLVSNFNSLNLYQKANCILKILDKVLLNSKNKNSCDAKKLQKLIIIEKQLLSKILNEK